MAVDLAGLARQHIGLLVSAAAGTLVVARLLLVSGYNYETSVTLLATQGTATVIFGSLLGVAYVLPTAGFLALLLIANHELYETGTVSRGVVLGYYLVGAVAVIASPLVIAGTIAVCMALVTVEVVKAFRRGTTTVEADPLAGAAADPMRYKRYVAARNIIMLWAVVVGSQVLIAGPPWMPAERVEIDGDPKQDAVVGYVLEDADNEIVVLRDSPREVVRLSNPDGFTRTYCTTDSEFWLLGGMAPITLMFSNASYPDC